VWGDIIIVAVVLLGIYDFVLLARFERRMLASKTSRSSGSMHDNYADLTRKQRKHTRQHGGA
jgi:hypothetical protein